MDSDDALHKLLGDFQRTVSPDVRPPGAEHVRRTVLRRQWVRTRAVAAFAAVALAGAAGSYVVNQGRHDEQPVHPNVTASASTASLPATPSAGPTATRTTAGSSSPTTEPSGSTSPRATGPAPSGPTDLRATAPATAVLVPTAGVYQGTTSITVTNSGASYVQTYLMFTLPAGISVSGPGMGPCLNAAGQENVSCYSELTVPAYGGQTTYQVTIRADFAPQSNAWSIPGFAVRLAPATSAGTWIADPTPDNNRVAMTLLLQAGG